MPSSSSASSSSRRKNQNLFRGKTSNAANRFAAITDPLGGFFNRRGRLRSDGLLIVPLERLSRGGARVVDKPPRVKEIKYAANRDNIPHESPPNVGEANLVWMFVSVLLDNRVPQVEVNPRVLRGGSRIEELR